MLAMLIMNTMCLQVLATSKLDSNYGHYPEVEGQNVLVVLDMKRNKCKTYNIGKDDINNINKIYKTIQKTGTGILKTYAMNCVFCTVNVNSSGYVMRFYNLGTKKLDLIKLRCVVKKIRVHI